MGSRYYTSEAAALSKRQRRQEEKRRRQELLENHLKAKEIESRPQRISAFMVQNSGKIATGVMTVGALLFLYNAVVHQERQRRFGAAQPNAMAMSSSQPVADGDSSASSFVQPAGHPGVKTAASRVFLSALGFGSCGFAFSQAGEGDEKKRPRPFQIGKGGESTFEGRFWRHCSDIDPRNLLYSNSQIKAFQDDLNQFKKTNALPPGKTDEDMRRAQAVVSSRCNSEGGIMFVPGTMAAFLPMNVPMIFLMLKFAETSLFWSMVLQVLNQSINTVTNCVNKASTDETSTEDLAKGYGTAVTVACGLQAGASHLAKVVPLFAMLGPFSPYFGVAGAGSANVALMRQDDITQGVVIRDQHGFTNF